MLSACGGGGSSEPPAAPSRVSDNPPVFPSNEWATATPNASLGWRANASRDDTLNGVKRRELSSGISASVDAMARIGYLFLRRGDWNGQRLLSESFVDTVRTPRAEVARTTNADATDFPTATENFGVLWWTNASGELAEVPRDAYWAWGLGDNLIVVVPSLDLVIARTGNEPDDPTLPQLRRERTGDSGSSLRS